MSKSSALPDLAAQLNTAVVHLNRQLRRSDVALGLPTAQASALALLVTAGAHTNSDLAAFELVSGPTMTRIVSALEKRGLVERNRTATDLRTVQIEATPEGRRLIREAFARRLAQLESRLERLDPAQRAHLAAAVAVLAALAGVGGTDIPV